jgi:hypothetical protein
MTLNFAAQIFQPSGDGAIGIVDDGISFWMLNEIQIV